VTSDDNFSSDDENEEEDFTRDSFYGPRNSITEETAAIYKAAEHEEPAPLVNSGYDLKIDMKLGWKPDKDRISGAPIPLHYEF
jgi:hypothetical protein